jgi:hypothetical protein
MGTTSSRLICLSPLRLERRSCRSSLPQQGLPRTVGLLPALDLGLLLAPGLLLAVDLWLLPEVGLLPLLLVVLTLLLPLELELLLLEVVPLLRRRLVVSLPVELLWLFSCFERTRVTLFSGDVRYDAGYRTNAEL